MTTHQKIDKTCTQGDLAFFKLVTQDTITIYEETYGKDKTLVNCGVCGATLELTKDLVHDLIVGQHEILQNIVRRIVEEHFANEHNVTKK